MIHPSSITCPPLCPIFPPSFIRLILQFINEVSVHPSLYKYRATSSTTILCHAHKQGVHCLVKCKELGWFGSHVMRGNTKGSIMGDITARRDSLRSKTIIVQVLEILSSEFVDKSKCYVLTTCIIFFFGVYFLCFHTLFSYSYSSILGYFSIIKDQEKNFLRIWKPYLTGL